METKESKKVNEFNNPQTEEIDLTKVFSKIYNALILLIKFIVRFLFTIADNIFFNIRLIALISFLGILLGIGYYFLAKPYYESNMTLSSAYYKEKFLSNTIGNLNRLASEGNYNVIGKLLKIPASKAKSLRSLEIEPTVSANVQTLVELYKETEGSKMRLDSLILNANDSTYQLTVQVYDTTTLLGLDTILVNYIKNNKFVDKRIAIARRNALLRKAKLARESKNLDTLKNYMARSYVSNQSATNLTPNGTNVTLNSKEVNPIDIYREDLRLYEAQLQIDKELFINSEIEIIDRFITFGKPASGTIYKHAVIGAIIGLIIALLYIFYLMVRNGLARLRYNLDYEEAVTKI